MDETLNEIQSKTSVPVIGLSIRLFAEQNTHIFIVLQRYNK